MTKVVFTISFFFRFIVPYLFPDPHRLDGHCWDIFKPDAMTL